MISSREYRHTTASFFNLLAMLSGVFDLGLNCRYQEKKFGANCCSSNHQLFAIGNGNLVRIVVIWKSDSALPPPQIDQIQHKFLASH
jgi:hypothetical protein